MLPQMPKKLKKAESNAKKAEKAALNAKKDEKIIKIIKSAVVVD